MKIMALYNPAACESIRHGSGTTKIAAMGYGKFLDIDPYQCAKYTLPRYYTILEHTPGDDNKDMQLQFLGIYIF